jgi:hypothetical protein
MSQRIHVLNRLNIVCVCVNSSPSLYSLLLVFIRSTCIQFFGNGIEHQFLFGSVVIIRTSDIVQTFVVFIKFYETKHLLTQSLHVTVYIRPAAIRVSTNHSASFVPLTSAEIQHVLSCAGYWYQSKAVGNW